MERERLEPMLIRLPASLAQKVKEDAQRRGLSYSSYLRMLLIQCFGGMKNAQKNDGLDA